MSGPLSTNKTKDRALSAFSKPLEFLQKVKYGGAVGKQTVIAVVALIALTVAMLSMWEQVSAVYVIVGAVVLVVCVSFFSIHKTLEKYHEEAMLEGKDLKEHWGKKMEMAAKQLPAPSVDDQRPSIEPGQAAAPLLAGNPEEPDE